ncbi:MAG: 6-phosphogluconolactonase [Coleofasciculaceae cyanobacterium RL_1_1]|nr:6-phosphogluconolactonase [Coleofasciculaceae cyanobacterium RL_1_1]
MTEHIEVLPDRAALVDRAFALTIDSIHAAIDARGRAVLALAGGSTPKPIYEKLSACVLPWDQIYIFWGDERYVPVDHPDSNAGMAKQAWLDHVAIPESNIFITPTLGNDPAADADRFNTQIADFFTPARGAMPVFDLIMLGMGDDGHTASLFPHTAALDVTDRYATLGEKSGEPRLTLTFPVLQHAHTILMTIAGSNKQTALTHIFAETCDDREYPSRRLRQATGELWWLLDAEAAISPSV